MPVNFPKNINMGVKLQPTPSRNTLFEVGLLVIICVLFVWFILLPKKAEVDKKDADLAKAQAQQADIHGQLATLQSLISSLPANSQNISNLDQAIPLDGNTVRLQLLIQSIAQSAGVTVGNISISGSPNGEVVGDPALLADPYAAQRTLQTMDGTIYAIGTFNQLEVLLKKFENSGRLIDIDSLAIGQGSEGNLSMTLTFKAYYFAP